MLLGNDYDPARQPCPLQVHTQNLAGRTLVVAGYNLNHIAFFNMKAICFISVPKSQFTLRIHTTSLASEIIFI